MPTRLQDFISPIEQSDIQFGLEPVFNMLHSMLLLTKVDQVSGFNEWVGRTNATMSLEERGQNKLVIVGFFFAIMPDRSWKSFPAFIDHLAATDPVALRDQMLNAYINLPCQSAPQVPVDLQAILADVESYLAFLHTRFEPSSIDRKLETEAFSYVTQPDRMQHLIVTHLKMMWERYLKFEWEQVSPMLEKAVQAFRQADLSNMDRAEAARWIIGQDLPEDKISNWLKDAERVVFVPSAHVGPYLGHFHYGNTTGILFGARLPRETVFEVPELSRAEITVRLSALSDDSRLRIMKYIAEHGEQRSQDIMIQLDLSQSATSRHLMQLSATGFLIERRCEGAKCYELNPERIEDTLQAIAAYLLGHPALLVNREGVYYG